MQEIKYALIYENKVKNVFLCENYELANQISRASFGNDAFAVEATQYIINIDDKYEKGAFYNILEDGTLKEVEYISTPEDKIRELQAKLSKSQIVLTEEYESKLSLEDKILTLQQIITDLYEKAEVNK